MMWSSGLQVKKGSGAVQLCSWVGCAQQAIERTLAVDQEQRKRKTNDLKKSDNGAIPAGLAF